MADVFWRKAADKTEAVRSHVAVCVLLRTTWMANHIYIFIMEEKKSPGDHRKQRRKTLLTETNSCMQKSATDFGTSNVVLHPVPFPSRNVTCPLTSCSAPSLKTVPFFGHACVVILLHYGWIGLWQRTWRNHKVDNKPEYKSGVRFVETRSVDDEYHSLSRKHTFFLSFPASHGGCSGLQLGIYQYLEIIRVHKLKLYIYSLALTLGRVKIVTWLAC